MLLTLPREVRDLIIDQVLLTPEPEFIPVVHNVNDPGTPENVRKLRRSPFPIPPFRCDLLAVCAQLRSETTERAPKLEIPFVLDILILEDGGLRYTWRSRPWRAPSEWGRVPCMAAQLRIQPISLKLCRPEDLEFTKEYQTEKDRRQYLDWLKTEAIEQVVTHTSQAIGRCVLSILQGDGHEPATVDSPLRCRDGAWRDRPGITKLPNSLAHLLIDFCPAVDEAGKSIGVPQSAVLEEWHITNFDFEGFQCFGEGYDEETLLGKDYLWPRHEGALSIEQFPLVTHVGSIFVSWDTSLMMKDLDGKLVADVGGVMLELDEENIYASPQDRSDVKRLRKQLGWG